MKKGMLVAMGLLTLVVLLALPVAAQTSEPVEIDPAAVQTILAGGILGLGVLAITQIVKGWFGAQGAAVILISLVVSALSTIVWLVTGGGGFVLLKFIGYTVAVWATANGWYKFHTA